MNKHPLTRTIPAIFSISLLLLWSSCQTQSPPATSDASAEKESSILYSNGKMAESGFYRDSVKTGLWKFWYPSGHQAEEASFKAGNIEGTHTFWYTGGQKLAEGSSSGGFRTGKWTWWSESGKELLSKTYEPEDSVSDAWGSLVTQIINLDKVTAKISFPSHLKRSGDLAPVQVRVLIGTEGQVKKSEITSAPLPEMAKAVSPHISDLRFTPHISAHRPSQTWVNVPFYFRTLK
ncbi:MAG: hypothetical protein EAZ89_13190 [Bacteroidetes bacterium]|nr:MAG: hypothetical protein EAZ89_13190 [Bacteroidota bacterium]